MELNLYKEYHRFALLTRVPAFFTSRGIHNNHATCRSDKTYNVRHTCTTDPLVHVSKSEKISIRISYGRSSSDRLSVLSILWRPHASYTRLRHVFSVDEKLAVATSSAELHPAATAGGEDEFDSTEGTLRHVWVVSCCNRSPIRRRRGGLGWLTVDRLLALNLTDDALRTSYPVSLLWDELSIMFVWKWRNQTFPAGISRKLQLPDPSTKLNGCVLVGDIFSTLAAPGSRESFHVANEFRYIGISKGVLWAPVVPSFMTEIDQMNNWLQCLREQRCELVERSWAPSILHIMTSPSVAIFHSRIYIILNRCCKRFSACVV